MYWKALKFPSPLWSICGKKFLFEIFSVTFECFHHNLNQFQSVTSSYKLLKTFTTSIFPFNSFSIFFFYFILINRDEILQQMRTFSGGRNTVPQIFFNSDHIGGNDDLQKLELDGKLNDKVATVRKNAVSYMQDNWFHPWY